jgi:hypothetical protein
MKRSKDQSKVRPDGSKKAAVGQIAGPTMIGLKYQRYIKDSPVGGEAAIALAPSFHPQCFGREMFQRERCDKQS